MRRKMIIAAPALLLSVTLSATAQLSTADHVSLDTYRSAIAAAKSATPAGGLESAFAALSDVRTTLMRVVDGRDTVLETLSDAEYQRLHRDLPGVLLHRETAVFVEPDTEYFMRLARVQGDPADRAFFAALKATYPASVWPVYVEQQTDASGCTRFGSMSLVETYRIWSGFRRTHSGRYAAPATAELDKVSEQLTTSTCACGSAADVVSELQRFQERFPQSPLRARIGARLDAQRAGDTSIRAYCRSG